MAAKKPAARATVAAGAKKKPSARPRSTAPGVTAFLEALHQRAKPVAERMRPPAAPNAIEALRRLEVPAAMSALYTLHDGSDGAVFGPYQLLSVAELIEERAAMNEILVENESWRTNRTWDSRWVPFMADGDGQLFVVDPGGVYGGAPGQVLFFDHEIGASRELASFDGLLDLLTTLADERLLSLDAWKEHAEKVDARRAEARSVGLAKMKPAALAATLLAVDDAKSAEEAIAILLPLVRAYPTEELLWARVASAAALASRWSLVVHAAESAMRLAPTRDKNAHVPGLFRGLHETGRDEEALAVLRAGLARITNPNERRAGLVPLEIPSTLRLRALRAVTELQPKDVETWALVAEATEDPRERARAREAIVDLVDAMEYPSSFDRTRRLDALRGRAHDAMIGLEPDARLRALLDFAAVANDGEWDVAWADAAKLAASLGRWDVVDAAAKKQLAHTYASLSDVCALRVRALVLLGREEDALALLGAALDQAYTGSDACFVAIPWHEERIAGAPVMVPPAAEFQARAFAMVTARSPENLAAWKWRRVFAKGSERSAVLRAIVALCNREADRRNDDGEFHHSEEDRASFATVRAESQSELG